MGQGLPHTDVIIIGAGLSGIGAACQLRRRSQGTSFLILEARDDLGGTWDLFRYPGVRSDSDMYTLSYEFAPWAKDHSIGSGAEIKQYIADAARKYDVRKAIRFGQRVLSADWSSDQARWTLTVQDAAGDQRQLTCGFLFSCTGYYNYSGGYEPTFAGTADFAGQIVHPQKWPEDLDYAGKDVVVIGSGATAVTLVPALAKTAGHVTMLQRSPSYMANAPAIDPIAAQLRRRLPSGAASEIVRLKNIAYTMFTYWLARNNPAKMTSLLRTDVEAALPADYDFDTHFSPQYNPWDQRLCLVPDGDLFAAISNGSASMVTDQIERFTANGIALASGDQLHADIIITATGLQLQALGGLQLRVDGEPVDIPSTVAYKGVMLAGVPNFALTIGYVNASWTLRSDLVARYVCRLLDFMRQIGAVACTPTPPTSSVRAPLLDLTSGYVTRGKDLMPKSSDEDPWRLHHNYLRDLRLLRHGAVADRALRFTKARVGVGVATD